jgi:spermidine/putrescine transport system ATP-binding protein
LGALDLKLRKQMQLELKRIQNEVGITFVYVTHDQEEAMTMSDRIAVMNAGKMEQIGAPNDVYDLPSTPFVAGFLGASNLLPGTIENEEGGAASVRLAEGELVTLPAERLPTTSGPVHVGVRPEKVDIRTSAGETAATVNAVSAVVTASTYTGVSTSYECRTKDGSKLVVYVQNVGAAAEARAGEEVRLTWEPEHTFAVAVADGKDAEEKHG